MVYFIKAEGRKNPYLDGAIMKSAGKGKISYHPKFKKDSVLLFRSKERAERFTKKVGLNKRGYKYDILKWE